MYQSFHLVSTAALRNVLDSHVDTYIHFHSQILSFRFAGAFLICIGISPVSLLSTSEIALFIARYEAFDFFDVALYIAASDKIILASGIPTIVTACIAAVATTNAFGFAIPTSSAAEITIRLAKNTGSSPPS